MPPEVKQDIRKVKSLNIVEHRGFLELVRDGELEIEALPKFKIKKSVKAGKVDYSATSHKGPLPVFWMTIDGSPRCFICVCDDDKGTCGCVEVPCAEKPKK